MLQTTHLYQPPYQRRVSMFAKHPLILMGLLFVTLLLFPDLAHASSTGTQAVDSPVPASANFKIKITIKDDLGGDWYILDKQDEATPLNRHLIKPTRQPDGSIKELRKGWRMWVEHVSPQSVKLSLKISNFDQVETFLLDKTPTKNEQCQTFSLGDNTDDNTAVCISIPTSTTKQEQGLLAQ
ncbi:ATP-binding region ATPase domain protein [Moritella viscosa]|uniref:hypothetical protein n=1 Tax=Moritella viscosa TaxID=80854 RepID=UPI00090FB258|nr:hypothetical protein [Moritella viscosa]SHO23809.1 ATP-binding region ATPase domain protein [Moritella viscosa]